MEIYNKLFELFNSRKDVYAEAYYDKNSRRYAYKALKKPLTVEVLKRHCTDKSYCGIGIYPLIGNNKCQWVAADFDIHDDKEKEEVGAAIKKILEIADGIELHIYMEYSKSGKGLHLWIFFSELIESWKARQLMMALIENAGASTLSSMDRLFPSQDRIANESKGFGNLIHMPFSAMFCEDNGGTIFKDRDGTQYTNSEEDIEAWLDTVERHDVKYVDAILSEWDLLQLQPIDVKYETDNIEYQYANNGLTKVFRDPFIVWCKENPKNVGYNAWLAMMSNLLPYGQKGIEGIHYLSSLDLDRYDYSSTQRQIIACQNLKPITYAWIIKNTGFKDNPGVSYRSPAAAGIKQKVKKPKSFNTMNAIELIDSDFVAPKPIIDQFLYENGVGLIAGADGVGKSLLALQAAISIAIGVPFLDFHIRHPHKVLLIQFELENGDLRHRLAKQKAYFEKTYPEGMNCWDNLKFSIIEQDAKMFIDQWSTIEQTVIENDLKGGVLIVDNLYTSTSVDVSDNNKVQTLLSRIASIRTKYGITILLINHHNKGTQKEMTLTKDLIRGGKSMTDFATNIFQMADSSLSTDLRIGKITKLRSGSSELLNIPFKLRLDTKYLIFSRGGIIPKEELHFIEPKERNEIKALKAIEPYTDKKKCFDRGQFIPCVEELGYSSPRTVDNFLKKLESWGLVKKIRYNCYQIITSELNDLDSKNEG